jgi:hypothetical protein
MPSRKELTSAGAIIVERSTGRLSSHNNPRHSEQRLRRRLKKEMTQTTSPPSAQRMAGQGVNPKYGFFTPQEGEAAVPRARGAQAGAAARDPWQ